MNQDTLLTDTPERPGPLEQLDILQSLVSEARPAAAAVVLGVSDFEITASFDFGGKRTLDVLNDALTEYLDCVSAEIHQDGQLIARLGDATIGKSEILVAAIVGDLHEAPEKRRNNRREMSQYEAVVSVGRFLVSGSIHLSSRTPSRVFLNADSGFFAVQNATVRNLTQRGTDTQVQVALVNRDRVSAMEIKPCGEAATDRGPLKLDY